MITSAQAEQLLMDLHGVDPWHPGRSDDAGTQKSAFHARLKYLRRLGWPQGVNTGKGNRARYSLNAIFQLAIGFELQQVGLTPERMVHVLSPIWQTIRRDIATAVSRPKRPYFLCFDSQALIYYAPEIAPGIYAPSSDLSGADKVLAKLTNDPALATFTGGWLEDVEAWLRQSSGEGGSPRLVILGLTRLCSTIETWLIQRDLCDVHSFRQEVGSWPEEDSAAEAELARAYLAGELTDVIGALAASCPESLEDLARVKEEERLQSKIKV